MNQAAEVQVHLQDGGGRHQRHKPMYVSPDVLNPTLCVSDVGVRTSKFFGPALASPSLPKVHTSLVSMLVANDMTENMISELLASGNAAPMMNTILRDPEGASSGQQDGAGENSAQARNVSLADAARLEATVGPRTVRAKHLPPALQWRYGMGKPALQPSEVHSVRRVFEDVPARADSAPGAFSSLLPQRTGSHSASAASRIANVLSMAQAAVRKERQRAAATSAPVVVRAGGTRGSPRGGRSTSAVAGNRMRGVHAISSRRAKSAGAAQGTATSPFVTSGRGEAGKVGYTCLRTGLAYGGKKGPACYEPQWKALRPHSASAALDKCYASAGRHLGATMSHAQKLKELALMGAPTCTPEAMGAESSRSSNGSHGGSIGGRENPRKPTRRFSVANVALGGVQMTNVHPKSPTVFQHERPTNSACFRTIPRIAPAAGFAHAQDSMTSDSVGPGSYRSSMHRSGLTGRRVHSASSKRDRQACSPAWSAPQPQSYGLPQQRRNQLSPGPGSYTPNSLDRPGSAADFTRVTPRPGSAPPLLPSQDSNIVSCGTASEMQTTTNEYSYTPSAAGGDCSMPKIQRGRANFHGMHVPCSCDRPHFDAINESQALVDTLEADDFIYDDEEDAEEGYDACLDVCDRRNSALGRHTRSASPGKCRLLDAVDVARSADEIQAALGEQRAHQRNGRHCALSAESSQGQVNERDEFERPLSAVSSRPVSARPPSGRPLSGKPKSALPPSGRPLSGRPLSGRPLSSQDAHRHRQDGFRAQAAELVEESLIEEVDEEETCSDSESLPEPSIGIIPRSSPGGALQLQSTHKNSVHATTRICNRDHTASTPNNNEEAMAGIGCSRSRSVSAGQMLSASLHTPWIHSESSCAGLHSGWSAPAYQSTMERSCSSHLQQQLAASSNLRCTVGGHSSHASSGRHSLNRSRSKRRNLQVRRPSQSAHASRAHHRAVGVASRMRPATACVQSTKRESDIPSVATWQGDSSMVVERPVSAFSNPEMAAEGMRLEYGATGRMHRRAVATAHPLSRGSPSADSPHAAKFRHAAAHASQRRTAQYSTHWAPGRLHKAREAQAASSAHAFRGHMHSSQPHASVSAKAGKKENQFSQANSTAQLQLHDPGYNSISGDNSSSCTARGKGITFAKSTREQELSGQRLMGVSGIVKPVSAKTVLGNDAFYDSSVTAASHRRRAPAYTLPPCRFELRQRRFSQARVSALDIQLCINGARMNSRCPEEF